MSQQQQQVAKAGGYGERPVPGRLHRVLLGYIRRFDSSLSHSPHTPLNYPRNPIFMFLSLLLTPGVEEGRGALGLDLVSCIWYTSL